MYAYQLSFPIERSMIFCHFGRILAKLVNFTVRGAVCAVRGSWFAVWGAWYVVCGAWYVVCGLWFVVLGNL